MSPASNLSSTEEDRDQLSPHRSSGETLARLRPFPKTLGPQSPRWASHQAGSLRGPYGEDPNWPEGTQPHFMPGPTLHGPAGVRIHVPPPQGGQEWPRRHRRDEAAAREHASPSPTPLTAHRRRKEVALRAFAPGHSTGAPPPQATRRAWPASPKHYCLPPSYPVLCDTGGDGQGKG